MQLVNFHTFCLCCFIENDTTCKNLFSQKKAISPDLLSRRNRLNETGKYSLTQGSASKKNITDASNILSRIIYAALGDEHDGLTFCVNCSEASQDDQCNERYLNTNDQETLNILGNSIIFCFRNLKLQLSSYIEIVRGTMTAVITTL